MYICNEKFASYLWSPLRCYSSGKEVGKCECSILNETDCREWRSWRLYKVTFFRVRCTSFHIHSPLLTFFLFHCLISILLFPCASVWENTRAWVPHFLYSYWMELVLFWHQYSFVVTCLLSKTKLNFNFKDLYRQLYSSGGSSTDRWVHFQQNAGLQLFVYTHLNCARHRCIATS